MQNTQQTKGDFHSSQRFQKFRNGDKWYGNFLGEFPENQKLLNFRKANIHAKFPEISKVKSNGTGPGEKFQKIERLSSFFNSYLLK